METDISFFWKQHGFSIKKAVRRSGLLLKRSASGLAELTVKLIKRSRRVVGLLFGKKIRLRSHQMKIITVVF